MPKQIIPTAEEFLKQFELGNTGKIDIEDSKEAIIEFAKLHVQLALREAAIYNSEEDSEEVLNVYPLTNIK